MRTFNNIEDIHAERHKQRDNQIIYTMLAVLIGEIDRLPARHNSTADEIYTVINKMYNSAVEMSKYKPESKVEADYLKDFIKRQLTDAELTGIILGYKEDGLKNIGDFMRALNAQYKGRFDGKMASGIINKILR